jgi:serine protease AprX
MPHVGPAPDRRTTARRGREGAAALAAVAVAAALGVPLAAGAAPARRASAFVPAALAARASAQPEAALAVVVVGKDAHSVAEAVGDARGRTRRVFRSIPGVAATVSGRALTALARNPQVASITPDAPLRAAAYEDATMWRAAVDGLGAPASASGATPAIAVVDSGIQERKEFPHLLAHVNLSSTAPATGADDEGHGTMVAGIAAANGKYGGAAQTFPLLDVRTADPNGLSLTSDVIAACDWILRNGARYNIRVANFSMSGDVESSFTNDPLDRAVERLWLAGIVVVAAAGNGGTGAGPVPIGAPANDPFVISVGATDLHSTASVADDTVPAWSAYGPTRDGFEKPELSAPGRYLIAPVPVGSTLARTFPERIVDAAPSMWMSGTSFAAPVVAGAAAQVLLRHPDWSPGRVKGALMLTARPLARAGPPAGVGEVNVAAAAALAGAPNANENLDAFVTSGTFDASAWAAAVARDSGWSPASWSSAGWSGAAWSVANWSEASWSEANWAEANWSEANWSETVWAGASWRE